MFLGGGVDKYIHFISTPSSLDHLLPSEFLMAQITQAAANIP